MEEKKVTVILKSAPGGLRNFPTEVSISRAISDIESGVSTCVIPLEDLKKAYQAYLLGDLRLSEKFEHLEQKFEQLQEDLSFLLKYKPQIMICIRIIHIAKRSWLTNWGIILTLLGIISGLLSIWASWPQIVGLFD